MKYFFSTILVIAGLSLFFSIQAQDVQVISVADSNQAMPPVIYKVNTGYLTQFVDEIISPVSVIDSKDLSVIPANNIINRLQGLVPGLNVMGSGEPGSIGDHFIRGIGSFWGTKPLYIVDGVPVDDITLLNPADVETIAVLKDGGSAAIYGARAMGGVISVTTKKGSKGLKIGYNMSYGWTLPGKGPGEDLLSADEYARLQWKVYENDGYDEYHPIYGPSTNPEPTMPAWGGNTDWYAEMTQNAPVQRHELYFRGGNDHSWIYGSFGAHSEDGLLIHTYDRSYHLRFNSEWNFLNDRVTIGENFTVRARKSNHAPASDESSPFMMGPYRTQSIIPVYMDRPVDGISYDFKPGDFGGTGIAPRLGNSTNVVADLIRNKYDYNLNNGFFGNAWLKAQIFKGVSFTSSFGGTYSTVYGTDYIQKTYERSENTNLSWFREFAGYRYTSLWTNMFQYKLDAGSHYVELVAGNENIKTGMDRNVYGERAGFFSDNISYRDLSSGNVIHSSGSYYIKSYPLNSLFLSANYKLKDKYLVSFSIRKDKLSNIMTLSQSRTDLKETYSSVSVGWKIGKENLFENLRWMNNLTLRASYGITGNLYGNWERSKDLDLGLIWKPDHFTVDFSWYRKESSDLLMAITSQLGGGLSQTRWINSGSMRNKGIDLRIGYDKRWNSAGIDAGLVLTTFKNEIIDLAPGTDFFDSQSVRIGTVSRNQAGHSVGEFFGYNVAGLYRNPQEVTDAPVQAGAEPGFFRYENVNDEDNEIRPDDRTFIGNPFPDFTMGLNLGVTASNFDVSMLLFWSQGNEIFNFTRWWTDFWPSFQGQKSRRLYEESWTEDNLSASVPKASNKSNFSTNTQINSYYVEDGSYLRMKSLMAGYRFNKELLSKVHISSLRIYVQALNLFTLTRYSGMDPEISGSLGIDNGHYPNARQFLFGFQIEI